MGEVYLFKMKPTASDKQNLFVMFVESGGRPSIFSLSQKVELMGSFPSFPTLAASMANLLLCFSQVVWMLKLEKEEDAFLLDRDNYCVWPELC